MFWGFPSLRLDSYLTFEEDPKTPERADVLGRKKQIAVGRSRHFSYWILHRKSRRSNQLNSGS
jgi:hypothetical protein